MGQLTIYLKKILERRRFCGTLVDEERDVCEADRQPLEQESRRVERRRRADDPRVLLRGGAHNVPSRIINTTYKVTFTTSLATRILPLKGCLNFTFVCKRDNRLNNYI